MATIVSAEARAGSSQCTGTQRLSHPRRSEELAEAQRLWYSEGNRLDYKPEPLTPLTVESFPPKAPIY